MSSGKRKDKVVSFTTDNITKRMLWRGQYDLLGLLSTYTIKFNLLMRNMVKESSKVTDWDEEVPTVIADDFWAILEDMNELQEITFPQCIRPLA
jgi:hypothetical protein